MTPRPYQLDPIRVLATALRKGQSCLDASDTGVGKTAVACWAALEAGLSLKVIAPKSVLPSWQDTMHRIGATNFLLRNIESLKADGEGLLFKDGKGWRWTPHPVPCVTVFDEVHRFSASDSQNARILAACPKPVLMLSATAATDPTKMRAIGHQLGLTTWSDWWQWCGRNGCKRGYFGGIQFRGTAGDLDRLHRQIFNTGRGVRVRIADLGGQFPRNDLHTLLVPADDLDAVDQAYHEELIQLQAQAANPLEAQIRARQVAEHNTIAAVLERAEDDVATGLSVAIFVQFRDTLARVQQHFDCPTVHGDQTAGERQAAVQAFGSDRARVIGIMAQAGGCGLDGLQDRTGAHPRRGYVFLGWSANEFRQVIGRLARADSATPTTQFAVIAEGTIAEKIRTKLDKKLTNIDLLNDGDLTPV